MPVEPDTYLLVLTNAILGICVGVCVLATLGAVLRELAKKRSGRRAKIAEIEREWHALGMGKFKHR